ncbi:MAG: PAS domain S-box protein [Desulfobacteraceae bacterium]|nr:PAS domain S-box protein [Desulfobacteraceae bacterium]
MTASKTSEEEAREYAESIIDTVHEPLIVLDQDLRVISASRSFYDVFKIKPEESLGRLIYDLGNKQWDIPELRELLETLLPRKTTLDGYEVEHEFADLGRRTMLFNAREIQRKSGKERLILLAIEDITERKGTKKGLRESEETYRLLVEASNDIVWTFDLSSMTFTYCSKSVETILGSSQEEVNGSKLDDIFPPETKKKAIAAFDQVFKGESNSDQVFIEAEHRHKDGSLVSMEINAMMHRDNLGQPVLFTGVSRDITERKRAEEALRRSENYYRAIFETSGTAMFIIEADTTIPLVNSNFEKLSGYLKQEVEGKKSWTEFIHPDDVEWMKENHCLRRQNPDAAPRQYEFRFITRHEEERNLLLAVDMIPGTSRSIASCIDITEQKQAEEALKEQSRTLNERNKELSCLYGISRLVESKGNSLDDILQGTVDLLPDSWQYPEAACARIKFEDRVYVTGNFRETSWRQAQDIISEKEVFGCVEIFYLEEKPPAHEGPFMKEERELIDAVAERLGNIIGHVRAQARLRRSEQKFRDIFNGSNDAVFIHGISGQFLEVNQLACSRLGYSREELLLMTTMDIDDDEYAGSGPQRIQDIDQKGSLVFESVHRCKDGSTIPVEISSRKIHYEGTNCILSIARDITERKKAKQEKEKLQSQLRQSQKMEAIGTLAGGVAHDFNNILSSVLGYTELSMEEVEKDSLVHQNLSQVLTAGNRAKDLVKQILRLSRREEQEFVPTPIVPLVKEALKMLRSTFPATIDIQENILTEQAIVHADPTQLHQAIINIATNARDAMSDGSGVLEVCLEPVSFDQTIRKKSPDIMPGDYICIAISDTGCGISDQYLNKIFEPYFTTKEKGTGTGLGLSMVHGIVKSHKGHISAHSEPGKGTAFYIYLPLAEQSRPVSPARKEEPLPTGTEKILLVDDEQPIVEMQQRMLERLGYEVTPRTSSIEALEAFRANPDKFDVLITDMTMPNMTGDRLAIEVKQIRPDVPVILCTGFSEKIDDQKKGELRIEGLMLKPVSRTELAETVRKILDKSGND